MDQIKIKDLEVYSNHGVFKEENVLGQKFLVSATLYTDMRKAGMNDEITDSIHYGEICHTITDFMKKHTYKLIETVAEQLAMELLRTTKYLRKITLEIKKPWAPVGLPIDTVSVEITRGWHEAYIALGSNIGDSKAYLDLAVEELNSTDDCTVEAVSEYIVTKPYGVTDQDDFLNGALQLRTLLTPEELLDRLHEIEQEAGRKRIRRWGPRTLDLDILFYDDLVMSTKDLIIPHVEIQLRDFVLKPLMELCPYKRHPVWNKTVAELLNDLTSSTKEE